jgi:hypothetical protein
MILSGMETHKRIRKELHTKNIKKSIPVSAVEARRVV